MLQIGLAAVANQSFSVQLGQRQYELAFRDANGAMAVTITRDGVPLVSGARIVAGTPLLPYRYQEDGNFVLTTDAEAVPAFDQFGVTQFLYFLTAAEVAALRGA